MKYRPKTVYSNKDRSEPSRRRRRAERAEGEGERKEPKPLAKYPNVRRCGNEPNKGKKQSKELDEGIRLAYGRVLGKAPAKFGNFAPEK